MSFTTFRCKCYTSSCQYSRQQAYHLAENVYITYCIYCDGVLFGLICDNNFYIKVTGPDSSIIAVF